jgi:RimJ/RimL family protein N-acetyltransferase
MMKTANKETFCAEDFGLEPGRIVLRRPRAEDRDVVFTRWASDPVQTHFMAWKTHTALEDADAFLGMCDGMWDLYGCGPLILEHSHTGEVMGSAGLMFGAEDDIGVGYILDKTCQGKGYATEALQLSVEVAREFGIDALTVCIHPANIASRRVAKKCGFVLDTEKPAGHFIFPQIDPHTEGYTVNYILQL